ncbi:MAG TPA: DUF2309 domain-containing protein [Acidobacteriota bacterium]|nr:DUF2309 domain-containing protein [Acidobacteriota bacterium]
MSQARHSWAVADIGLDLKQAIDHAAHYLPAQGPIGVFIHHNTLHAFQHLPFETAVREAMHTFGTRPYLTEAQYQAERRRGRIVEADIDAVLADEPEVVIFPRMLTRRQLRRAILVAGLRPLSPQNVEWQIDECGLMERLRPDLDDQIRQNILEGNDESVAARTLFAACFQRISVLQPEAPKGYSRPRDRVLDVTGVDIDEVIHPWLIRFCSVFLDQGMAYWPMPKRERGLYQAVRDLMRQPLIIEPARLSGLRQRFEAQARAGLTATDVVLRHLDLFGLDTKGWEAYLTAELLALSGWAGLIRRLEEDPGLAPHIQIPCTLTDFLAVRLTMTAVAVDNLWREHNLSGNIWAEWRVKPQKPAVSETEHMAAVARFFDVAQLLGLSAKHLLSLSHKEFQRLCEEVTLFDELERCRILHLAYEKRHEALILQPLSTHRRDITVKRTASRPAAQVFFCIDEREESMRRALEELAPEVETFGAAGFYGVAVNFQGLDDPHGVALCPVVVKPQHAVLEKPRDNDHPASVRRQNLRRLWSNLAHTSYVGSRTLIRGWIGTSGLGLVSIFPLITRVLAPRRAGQIRHWLSQQFLPQPRTRLTLVRTGDTEKVHDLLLGFSPQEQAERVAGVLKPAGLVANHARLVLVLGHGSTSLNNPHESAHDCGACGGRRGGPNARLFAAMANHPDVRARLRHLGVEIPADTWFVGGYHDTCNDDVVFFDQEEIPASHRAEFARMEQTLDQARAANALERARRFEAAHAVVSPREALSHVQERSEHLAEPRPEYGHATNAVCVVGRRSLTRSLFLDRRAFLVSYDPDLDSDEQLLTAVLGAAGPVCAGINLEYYFSFVDNERYGCGTKLPHNVTGLVGVMNGHASDLRTGLPWQMVEIHEPVRLLLIVETSPHRLMKAVNRSAVVSELVKNRWIRLATIDPDDGHIEVYRDGHFEPFSEQPVPLPEVSTSVAWYSNKLEHLPVARINQKLAK